MTQPGTRLLAAAATALGLVSGGVDAHLAPQSESWWHGLTGSPSPALVGGAVAATLLVWTLGRVVEVRPFIWMLLGLFPLAPAITGYGGALLFFSRYTMILVFAVLLGWTTRDLLPSKRLQPFSAFVIAFAFFLIVGRYVPGPAGPQGDEPHYLLIAESLIRDGDVDLQNQFDERAFAKFTSGNLTPHTAPRSPQGRLYAIHTLGLSALIAPGYAAGGFAGARAMVSLVMAAVVGLLFLTGRSLFGEGAAHFVFFLSTFASPLPVYANSVFPDSVATLPVAAALACMVSPGRGLLALTSAAIAALPWMHPRFLPLAIVLALAVSLRDGFSASRAAAMFAPLLISVGLLLAHFQSLFGNPSLSAAYGPGFASDVSLTRIPWGASALVFDRQFGLLLFTPVLLLGLPGVAKLWRTDRRVAGLTVTVTAVLLGVGGAFTMWWGGASAPARFLIGAVPALILVCGALWKEAPDRRPLLGGAAGFGLGLLWLACLAPRALHNRGDGESGLLRLLAPVLDLDRFFPGFILAEGATWIALAWLAVLVATSLRPSAGRWVALLPLVAATTLSPTPLLNPFAASLRALESWSDHRRTFGGRDSDVGFALEVPLGDLALDLTPRVRRYSPRFSLPDGPWMLRVESQAETSPGVSNVCRLSLVTDDEDAPPLASTMLTAGDRSREVPFVLTARQSRVHLRGEGMQLRARILKVTLVRAAFPK